jgi:UDP:flavonoid glycosyltransferase YjiC (YdhE family)
MATILFCPYTCQLGSTHPLVAIADKLRDKGHTIHFACSGKYDDYIREAGYTVHALIDIDYDRYKHYIGRSRLDYHSDESIAEFVKQELEIFKKLKPDVVVSLNRPTLKLSCFRAEIPLVTVSNTPLTRYYDGQKAIPESHALYKLSVLPGVGELMHKFVPTIENRLFKVWSKRYARYADHNKINGLTINSFKDLFEGELTLLMDASELVPTTKLPEHVKMVGPIIHELEGRLPEWINRFDGSKPTLFVSMGTSGALFSRVLEYLSEMYSGSNEYQIVATTAGMHQFPEIVVGKNFYLTDYVPSRRIAQANCKTMISHGGRGSMYSALQCGVPLLGIPHQGEQEWNMDMITSKKIGVKVSAKKLSRETLQDGLEQIYASSEIGENAKRFKSYLQNYDGAYLSAVEIEKLLKA